MSTPTGRPYSPRPEIQYRLRRWRELATIGWKTEDIARELGVSMKTLRRCVSRARAHGHPHAIKHPITESHIGVVYLEMGHAAWERHKQQRRERERRQRHARRAHGTLRNST